MGKITLRGLLARKLRLALTAIAIVLGVTFVDGTLVLGETLNRTFNGLIGGVYQHVRFEVRGKAAFHEHTPQSINVALPVPSLIGFVLVSAILGLVAATWPARRAARLDVLAAIAAE